jgi:L-fuconolactonase
MKPERIDSHQHFWHYSAAEYGWIDDAMKVLRRDFLPADLRPELAAAGIAGCIAVQTRQTLEETRFLLGLAAKHPEVRGVVGWVDLRSPDVEAQLREFTRNPRFVGVRHIAQSEPDPRFLVSEPMLRGIAALSTTDLVYDVLVYPHQLPAAIELAARFPGQRFVLDHLAKPDLKKRQLGDWTRDVQALAKAGNVACKLSGLVTEADWRTWSSDGLHAAYAVGLDAFGPQRLLFGSDWPVCLCATDYRRWVDTVHGWLADLPEADRAAVLGGNATRLYHLKKPR